MLPSAARLESRLKSREQTASLLERPLQAAPLALEFSLQESPLQRENAWPEAASVWPPEAPQLRAGPQPEAPRAAPEAPLLLSAG